MLGYVLEALAGVPYAEAVRTEVLGPLRLSASVSTITHETRERLALGYASTHYDDRPARASASPFPTAWFEFDGGSGSLACTASDLATFLRMLLNRGKAECGRFLSEESFNLMTQPVVATEFSGYDQGYGLLVGQPEQYGGHTIVWTDGEMIGYIWRTTMIESQTDVQQRYQAALDALVSRLEQDRYVLAAVVYGSVARGEAWEKSDIDLEIIVQDGTVRTTHGILHYWLTEDGINISAAVVPRSAFKRYMDGALQGSMMHSIRSQCKLVFSKDESIATWLHESDRVGARDQDYQLLRIAIIALYDLAKAEKWFYVKEDVHYSFVWIMYTVNVLAQVEVVLNGEAPSREVIHQALKYNPAFFNAVYAELIDGPKNRETIQEALNRLSAYLEQHAERIFRPLLAYLAEADGSRTISEINATFRKKVQRGDLLEGCEWLARKGIIEKVAAPVRLTRKSRVILEEPAYYYDTDAYDWDQGFRFLWDRASAF